MVHYVTKLKNEIEKLATEKNEVVEENSRNVVLIGELREEIRRLREEVGSWKEEAGILKGEVGILKEELGKIKKENEELKDMEVVCIFKIK